MSAAADTIENTAGAHTGADRPRSPVYLIAWASVLEILRRKDIYVLFILVSIYLVFVLASRIVGIGSVEAARFLLNLGITTAFALSAILAAMSAARQLTREWEDRTIYPLLAKPVSRFEVVLGKWLAVTVVGSAVMLILSMITLVAVPSYPGPSILMFGQALLAQCLALSILSGIVLLASVWLPQGMAIVLGLGLYCCSGYLAGFLSARLGGGFFTWVAGYIPDFAMLDLAQRFTDGGPPLGILPMLGILAYGVFVSAVFLFAAAWKFERKAL
jgi:ABC-type transport system involved in multi-copper enzyme maturation permease subunit